MANVHPQGVGILDNAVFDDPVVPAVAGKSTSLGNWRAVGSVQHSKSFYFYVGLVWLLRHKVLFPAGCLDEMALRGAVVRHAEMYLHAILFHPIRSRRILHQTVQLHLL